MIARLRQGYAEAYGRIAPSGCFDWREKVWLVSMRWRVSTPRGGGVTCRDVSGVVTPTPYGVGWKK